MSSSVSKQLVSIICPKCHNTHFTRKRRLAKKARQQREQKQQQFSSEWEFLFAQGQKKTLWLRGTEPSLMSLLSKEITPWKEALFPMDPG